MAKALLVMDVQKNIVARIQQPAELLNHIKASTQAAREKQIIVIYVTVQFRKDYPEISANNKSFSNIKFNPGFDSTEHTAIHPTVAPAPNDLHVIKRRVSAFAGSDLEVILRSKKVDHLVLCGIATSGVVLSTLREAADKDYVLTVLEDCCADADEEVHNVLTKKVFPRQAEVLKHTEWIATLK
jgi:nicotinamidase-related amidase